MNTNINKIRPEDPLISIVVPVFNEEESIVLFLDTIHLVFKPNNLRYEVIFVNDGSGDNTLSVLQSLLTIHDNIKIINLSRNFGKEIALSAGIDYASGDVVVPIDVDLQDPPELILKFIEYWRKDYDVVYGVRVSRKHDNLFKRITSTWFYRIFNKLSHVKVPENAGDFRLIDRKVVEVLRQLPERNRFMKGLFSWVGFKSISVPYERPPRAVGITKWNQWSLWNFALDGIVSFSTLPLRVWTYVGLIVASLSFSFGIYIIVRTLFYGIDLPGYASLLTTILFLGGIQLLSIGILGEYIGRLFIEVKGRPLYIIESVYPLELLPEKT